MIALTLSDTLASVQCLKHAPSRTHSATALLRSNIWPYVDPFPLEDRVDSDRWATAIEDSCNWTLAICTYMLG